MRQFTWFCSLTILLYSCSATVRSERINGVSYVASRVAIEESHVKPVVAINANYAAVMPFGFIRDMENPEIIFDTQRQWFGETKRGAKQYIEALRKQHIKIMLKPQIWLWRGEFTGFLKLSSEKNWQTLETSYTEFILKYAQLAEETGTEILCIGTELEQFIVNRPDYWNTLIAEIKSVYKGKLTYAANWDEFKRTPFWSELDYIGVDAYFPVSDEQTPTVEVCKQGWQKHKSTIKNLSRKYQKPILFTEYGYRSVDYAAKEPWKSDRSMSVVNLEAQANALQALYEEFWAEDWFAGGFIWKWYYNHEKAGALKRKIKRFILSMGKRFNMIN